MFIQDEQIRYIVGSDNYSSCYGPQFKLRVVFVSYAMNFAIVSLLVTLALMVCDEAGETFDRLLKYIGFYLYISFGPMLLMFSVYGFTDFDALSTICGPHGI